jgi:hypothetical protein
MFPRLKQPFLRYGVPFLSVLAAGTLTKCLTLIPNENRTMTVFFMGAVMISTLLRLNSHKNQVKYRRRRIV